MNDASQENEIIRRWQAGQAQRSIARELGINRKRVARVVREHRQARDTGGVHPELPAPRKSRRGRRLAAFEPALCDLLERYPDITVVRLLEELRGQGYTGSYTVLREQVRLRRIRPARPPVVRFETPPGAQAQMDWGTYEIDFTLEGRRRVQLFSYLLSYSRRQYLCFTEQQDMENTLRQHVRAFEYLDGVAATCLYDNMKVVVQRWEDDHPVYNTRFLTFATHYGYRPVACRPRRPETKGKVERAFLYAEKNLLNGRTFRSLEHLNEVTRWWLANVADVRQHRETKKRPLDAHAEELPHLLSLPAHAYDTALVVYRMANPEGWIDFRQNHYSVPWQYIGELLPVRVTEDELLVYNNQLETIAQHRLLPRQVSGQQQLDPRHQPPRSQQVQVEHLQQRFGELGEVALRFLEGLLRRQRYGKHQAVRVLALLRTWRREDLRAAMERAVRYHAYALSSLERILAIQATPKSPWQALDQDATSPRPDLPPSETILPRDSREYQRLLFDEPAAEHEPTPDAPSAEPPFSEEIPDEPPSPPAPHP
jgi:transposase